MIHCSKRQKNSLKKSLHNSLRSIKKSMNVDLKEI